MSAKKGKSRSDRELLMERYMAYVLENESMPRSIYKFCKENAIKEEDFYTLFGSLEGLMKSVWDSFFDTTLKLLEQNKEYDSLSNKDKLLTFFFSFFELLTLNRSYVLFVLDEQENTLRQMNQLKGLRSRFKDFSKSLIEDGNSQKAAKLTRHNPALFSEGAWIQLLFLLKFWMKDSSVGFEKTDIAIEKSVNTVFDLFENTPLDSILDFGKFLYKERMA